MVRARAPGIASHPCYSACARTRTRTRTRIRTRTRSRSRIHTRIG